jgi:hypothetical protein
LITAGDGISDKVNYNISGQVSNASFVNPSLQKIAVNVSYLQNKEVQLTGYKIADGSLIEPTPKGLLVTDNIGGDTPTLPQGYSWFCAGAFKGSYHVFTTGTTGPFTVTWKFYWSRVTSGSSFGAPMMAIYAGTPIWVERDSEGAVREDGTIMRSQANWPLGSIGDLPGPGGGERMCDCYGYFGCDSNCSGELDPIAWAPHHCTGLGAAACWIAGLLIGDPFSGSYPCCGACYTTDSTGSPFWTYDTVLSKQNGYTEYTLKTTTDPAPGTYTVLFFNAENRISFDTTSASVTYVY